MENIVIDYPANVQVEGAQTVHAMQDEMTFCKRHPFHFSLTSQPVTCRECLRNMPLHPSPVAKRKPHKPYKKRKATEFTQEHPYTARMFFLTEKGQALVDKWEREEKEAQS